MATFTAEPFTESFVDELVGADAIQWGGWGEVRAPPSRVE